MRAGSGFGIESRVLERGYWRRCWSVLEALPEAGPVGSMDC